MKPITSRPDEAPFAIERFLPFRLSVLSNRLTRAAARVYTRRFRLSAPEWRTLAVLGRYGAMNANAVVERTAMDKVRVSRAVARLLSAGHITRHADTADRRRAVLELTPRGDGVYRDIVPLVRSVEDELLQDLSGEERATLERIFAKIEARARPMLQDEAVPPADDGEPTG
jgi:DNA-binding MarR family transcriptional regulator